MPLLNSIASATITLYKINEIALYQAELISTNGNIFHPYDMDTELHFNVFKDMNNIVSSFKDIVWTRYSFKANSLLEDNLWGRDYKGKSIIKINKNDFTEKCVIQADAYEIINGKRTCVASARITLIDINELYSSDTPPENPIDGSLWVDTSGGVPIIYSWNEKLKEWTVVGRTTPNVRNLLTNSNFWRLNSTGFSTENENYLLNLITVDKFEKTWLRLKSYMATENINTIAGVHQTTVYPIVPNSDYTFSFLAFNQTDAEYDGDKIYFKIILINEFNESVEVDTVIRTISKNPEEQISYSFKTLNDTQAIKVIIGVEPTKMCDFYITELCLYNTNKQYPWELSPEDLHEQLNNKLDSDHNSVFNALTKNGTMEGIYISVDENGNEHYFFNASHIKTGSLDGGLINGIGLNIKDDVTGQSIFHVYKDENGTHIDMVANNLYIGTEPASTQQYADTKAAEAETNAAGYTDTTVATNRAESEEILNGNIASSAATVTKTMTDYVDEKIEETITSNEGYTDDSVGSSSAMLLKKIDEAEAEANKYTDEKISTLSGSTDQNLNNVKKQIEQAKTDAIKDSKSYTDTEVGKVNQSLTEHANNMNEFITNQTNAINNAINQKADISTVDSIHNRLTTVETATKANSLVSTIRNSTEYKADLQTKLNVSEFTSFKTSHEEEHNKINESIEGFVKKETIIADINSSEEEDKISKDHLDLSSMYGDIENAIDGIYCKAMYGNNKLLLTPDKVAQGIKIDDIISNLDFNVIDTALEMDISKIAATEYVKVHEDNSHIYINEHEMIKLLLHQMKSMQKRMSELEDALKTLQEKS